MKATVCLHGDWSLGGLTFGDSRIQIKTVRRANRTLKQRLVLLHPCAANASYLFRRDPEESGSGSLGHSKEMKHRGAAPLQGLCNILILVQNVEDILEHIYEKVLLRHLSACISNPSLPENVVNPAECYR